jgi:hypothetical protein
MLNRIAAVLLIGAAWFGSAMLFPSPAGAQVINSRQAVCDPQYPTRCIKPAADGSIAVTGGGGGGGGASATAAANGTVAVVAGTNKPQAIDLFSSTSVLVKDTTGAAVDWSAPVPVTQSGAWSLTANQSINTSQVAGVTTATGNGVATTGTQRVTIASDNTAFTVNATATGNVAAAGADSGNPVKIGGVNNTTLPTYSTGQRGDLQIGIRGSLSTQLCSDTDSGACARTQASGADGSSNSRTGAIMYNRAGVFNGTTWDSSRGDTTGLSVNPYGITAQRWNYAAAASGIVNTTTAVTIKTAAGAGLRNCVASLDVMSDALGAATELAIRDGAGGTVLYRTRLGTAGLVSGRTITFPAAVCGTANTLLEVVTLTASITGAVYVNATGNIAP